jgi:hypothetical protein
MKYCTAPFTANVRGIQELDSGFAKRVLEAFEKRLNTMDLAPSHSRGYKGGPMMPSFDPLNFGMMDCSSVDLQVDAQR